jgi:hypothetical protein
VGKNSGILIIVFSAKFFSNEPVYIEALDSRIFQRYLANMHSSVCFLLLTFLAIASVCSGFQRPVLRPILKTSSDISESFGGRMANSRLYGGKQAKFGIFSPVVYAAKFVLGEAKLNKVRHMSFSSSIIMNSLST